MGREYSTKRSVRARSNAPHQFLVIIMTFLLGYLTATVFDIETLSRWVNKQVLAHSEMNKAPSKPQSSQQAAIAPKPKFEFYTLLTNEKAPNSQPAATSAATNSAATAQSAAVTTAAATSTVVAVSKVSQPVAVKPLAPAGKGAFLVQVASFKARQDAEHMKGLLILKGFSVSVIPINHATRGTWFRVVVGPYANRTLAQNAQMNLAKNQHLRGMLIAG